MTRNVGTLGLLFASVSAILGSGWLFAGYYTAYYAGFASVLSWLIGAGLVIVIAFVFAEVCTTIPVTGSSTRIPHYTHGTITSFTFAWIIWLSYLTLAPTEVQAIIQYLSYYFPSLLHANGGLTAIGLTAAAALMLMITTINAYSLRWLLKANTLLTIFKLVIPLFIAVVLLIYFLPKGHLFAHMRADFAPYGMHGTFEAVSVGGIAFAFTGFKIAAEMAGNTARPKVALPVAIVGSIGICLLIFLLLQFAFLAGTDLLHPGQGWRSFDEGGTFGPFAKIAGQAGLDWLIVIIFVGAIIGPFAAGLIYFGSAARALHGMSENGYLPKWLTVITPGGVPKHAIITSFVVGMLMFAPFPGWDSMVKFLTALMAMTYLTASTSLITLRTHQPDLPRPFQLICGKSWAVAGFFASTLIVYWSGWEIISKTGIAVLLGLVFLFAYTRYTGHKMAMNWLPSLWFWIYLLGISLISYAGGYGGTGMLSELTAIGLLLILSIVVMLAAMWWTLPDQQMRDRITLALENQDDQQT